jgi:hypothetical protein
VVMNAARKLIDHEVIKRRKKHHYLHNELLEPGEKIILATSKANTKHTTLWFTDEELAGEDNMLDTLIACGQFTTCFNLLEYIERTIKNEYYQSDYKKYDEATQTAIDQLQASLMTDWIKFKEDPYWMVNEWNEKKTV